MKFAAVLALVILSGSALAEEAKLPAKPVCTPPEQLTIKLPLGQAVVLNNILQDADVIHREWRDVAANVRAQLVGQCKETQK